MGREDFVRGSADVVVDFLSHPDPSFSVGAGVEWQAHRLISLRAGYTEDRIRPGHFASIGLGGFFPPGLGFDVAYRHQFGGTNPNRQVLLNLRIQPFKDVAKALWPFHLGHGPSCLSG